MPLLEPLASLFQSVETYQDTDRLMYRADQICSILNYSLSAAVSLVSSGEKKQFELLRNTLIWHFSVKGVYELFFGFQKTANKPTKLQLFDIFETIGESKYYIDPLALNVEDLNRILTDVQDLINQYTEETPPEEPQP